MPSANENILNVPLVYTKALTEGIKDDRSAVNLARGDSEFQTPKPIIDYLCEILPDQGSNLDDINSAVGKYTHYEKGRGSLRLRQAVARKYKRESGLDINVEEILITQGGMNAIFTSFLAVTEPGDEILIPDPCYVAYDPIANYILSGRKGSRIKLKESNDFILTVDQLNEAITANTKALILTSPLNPTGSLYSKEQLKEIMSWGIDNDVFVIHDENHEKEIYDGNIHYPISLFDNKRENSILLNSFSRLGMGGWRLGWMIASPRITEIAALAHSYINMTCNTFVQEAGVFTLDQYEELGFNEIFKDYEKKRDYLIPELDQLDGFSCIMPKSTCYAFPNIRMFFDNNRTTILSFIEDQVNAKFAANPEKEASFKREIHLSRQSISFAVYLYLLLKAKVGVIPGSAYGPQSDDYIRFSFSVKKDALVEGVRRLKGMYASL